MAKKRGVSRETDSGYSKVFTGLASGISNVAGVLVGRKRSCAGGLGLTRREENAWVATLRAWSEDDHAWMVAFGNGKDPIEALVALNGSVSRASWHVDKFSKADLPDWKVVDLMAPVLPPGLDKRVTPPTEMTADWLPERAVDTQLTLNLSDVQSLKPGGAG